MKQTEATAMNENNWVKRGCTGAPSPGEDWHNPQAKAGRHHATAWKNNVKFEFGMSEQRIHNGNLKTSKQKC